MLKLDFKRTPKKSDIDIISCEKRLEGCGFINHNNINKCLNCGKILKSINENTEG
jgi:hypothetical protein